MEPINAKDLIEKFKKGTLTDQEKVILETWYIRHAGTKPVTGEEGDLEQNLQSIWERIDLATQPKGLIRRINHWPRIAAAGSILLFLSAGGYFLFHKRPNRQTAQVQPEQIAPVNKGVVLSLGNGRRMVLNQQHKGYVAAVGGTQINQSDSLLSYNGKSAVNAEPVMNTLTNNSGKKFSLVLADETEAILDVASSLTYPASFTGKERKVTVTGQVFFKVKHNATKPFQVTAGTQQIEDIGTEFNINAYADEPAAKTTLVSGSVKVSGNLGALILKPGEQAISRNGQLTIAEANIEEVTAWLQGKIVFHHETLESILRKVARIYDVQIVWVDDVRNQTFGGSVSRSKKLSTVLNYFRKAGNVDFMVEGKTVKVFKKKK